MKNAYECKETYSRDGKCVRRERAIGPIVVLAIILIIAMLTGTPVVGMNVWQWLKF